MKKHNFLAILMMVLLAQIGFAQQKTVTGTVSDDGGIPLLGVTIIVKGSSTGTSTDFDGNYSITVDEGETLLFSYVGYNDVEKVVGSENEINVTLVEDAETLEEVVVTAFGRTMTRNESTSSVVTVTAEEISKSPFVDAQQALQGKVSGLVVNTTSGVPGAAPEIRIRGMNSINASNAPLYVVDGVPVNSGNVADNEDITSIDLMAMIGTSNIESISVLKDAAAVAPYGADGANGVILITTKSGLSGDAKYSLNFSTGVINHAKSSLKMVNAEQRYEAIREAAWNTWGSGQFGSGAISSRDGIDDFFLDQLGVDDIEVWKQNGRPDINWNDEVTNKDAITTGVDFSVTQGNERSKFYASLGYNKTEGTALGSGFNRWNGSIKYDTDLNDKLNLNISANVSNVEQNAVLEEAAYFSNPNLAKYFLSPWANPYNDDGSYNIGSSFSAYSGGLHNVLYTTKENITNNDITRAIQNTTLSYDILDNLSFRTTLGLDYTIRYFKEYRNPFHGDGEDENGTDYENSLRMYSYTSQNALDYNFTLNDDHNFRITAVQEFSKYKDNYLWGYGENFPNGFMNNMSASAANWEASSSFNDQMKMRYVGLVNYNFAERYLVDASYSYQGDSRFSNKFDSFYSIGLGWNLHEEDFLIDNDVINTLRLKAGYGITGNAGIGRNRYQQLVGYNAYRDQPAAILQGYGTEAEWEKSQRFDVGLNFGLFHNRLVGALGFYSNKTTDMLFDVPLPLSATYIGGSVLRNAGEMTNRGIEFEIAGDIIQTPDFNWNAGINFSTLANKVTSMPENSETITSTYVVQKGHKVYEWYMKEWAGINPDNGLPLWYINSSESDATTSNYAEAEEQYMGTNPLPKYSGAFSTRFDYKNFFLEGTLYFAGGHQVYEDWARYTQSTDGNVILGMNTSQAAFDGAWREPGDNATYPRFDFGSNEVSNAYQASSRWLYDGDFMRLRDIAIGYTFDPELIERTGLDGLSISVRGSNLLTWVKDSDLEWDPEVRTNGFTNLTTPPTKSILLNVNLNF